MTFLIKEHLIKWINLNSYTTFNKKDVIISNELLDHISFLCDKEKK